MGRYHHLVLALLATAAVAQQGVLTNGNSNLPTCGQSCPLLVQAAQACSGTDVATQGTWVCFCQSAYLVNLRSSATGICDSTCTSPTDLQQVSTWYRTNCGSDNGASEHADAGTGTAANPPANGAANPAGGAANPAGGAANPAGGQNAPSTGTTSSSTANGANSLSGVSAGVDDPGTWWENHYKWIIMLIVMVIAFPLIAWGAVCLKRRHDRKQDQIMGGFNAGITTRPPMSDVNMDRSTASIPVAAAGPSGSGRNSPQRTREAFMPAGYGYSRSSSRNGSRQGVHPLARGDTPADIVERGPNDAATGKGKRVMVREESVGEGSSDGKDGAWV
ncbi:hypothetical protein CERZMDRAFT_52884 [Cercospora zeae-maydis SCOH1-5]|uniref:Integral membrane protein n=1 Tax=Cercospora zeae-maydis SCOH1-5 TaxID=717836 RepID=A0A6A6EYI7_9PEZI|nr:hypothetical protein CERZMDRAFT_52884 [Cercospora zeae-maydis SCOH1-5]